MAADPDGVGRVAELTKGYEEWQTGAARRQSDGAARLLAIVEAVRQLCLHGESVDRQAVALLRERTGLDFRAEGASVLFELADDKNPGKTQTIVVRAADAGIE